MSANAHYVRQNFVWRLETLTATSSILPDTRFREFDPFRLHPEQVASRCFTVTWLSSGADHVVGGMDITDGVTDRIAEHTFQVAVYYDAKFRRADLQDMVLLDRHDMTKLLRSTASYLGYDASHTTTNIGLHQRVREGDELALDNEQFAIYRATWRCVIDEREY